MGGGSSPAGQTTSTQQSAPWAGQSPYLSEQFQGAQNLYQGPGPQYYPSSTYAPLTGDQQYLIDQLKSYGSSGGAYAPAAGNYVQNLLTYGPMQQQAENNSIIGGNVLHNVMDSSVINPSAGAYNSSLNPLSGMLGSGFTQPAQNTFDAANGMLAGNASSGFTAPAQGTYGTANSMLANELSPGYLNPWNSSSFQTVVNNTLANVLPATTASFVNGNRSDSGLAQRAATMAATDAVGNLAQNQYNTNQQIQQNAAQQAANNYLAQVGLQQNAAQQAANNYTNLLGLQQGAMGQAANNYMNLLGIQNNAAQQAANNLATQQGRQLQGAALAPGFDQALMGNIGTSLGAAGLEQQNQQNITNADVNRWNYYNNLPYQQLGNFANLIGGNYGGTSTLSQPYFQNGGANAMSGALGGAATGAMLGSIVPGIGTGIGALGGGVMGLLGSISDRRLKRDISRVRTHQNGLPIYRFRYINDNTEHTGFMAQDVLRMRPWAVGVLPSGVLFVDYDRAAA